MSAITGIPSNKKLINRHKEITLENCINLFMYYNNFNIISVNTWNTPDIQDIVNKIDENCYIYYCRWDDTPFTNSLGYSKFYLQFEDNYVFRPSESDYYDLEKIKAKLLQTTPKKEWGMIWCM